jgi:hypothetical protein
MDVDPSGKWVVAGGKLQPATTVLNFEKLKAAIDKKDFVHGGDVRGVPVLEYNDVVEGEAPATPLRRPRAASAKFGGSESARCTKRLPRMKAKVARQKAKRKSPARCEPPKCKPAARRSSVSRRSTSAREK